MATNSELPVGKLFINSNILLKPKWMVDLAISAAQRTLNKYRGFDGYMSPSETRDGDFSLILGFRDPDPYLAMFVGIPGPGKTPILQEIYLKKD